MIKTKIECPNCKNQFTGFGEPGTIEIVLCPKCKFKGKIIFKKQDYLIEVRNIHKIYDGGKLRVHALRGIDLNIKKGEMVALMGVSGCGKTTLLNCISGLDNVTKGFVRIEGRELNYMSDEEKTDYRAKNMGFIFQFYNLLPVLNALENVELPLLLLKESLKEARIKALNAIKMVGLHGWEMHKPAELSGGQRQRITIARSLVNNPLIVFGDEPTGDLDRETSEGIMDLLCELNKKNKQTFILVTHDSKIAERADRVLVMDSGKIKKEYYPTHW
jgi:putative ABC transport system ATP-binding protein